MKIKIIISLDDEIPDSMMVSSLHGLVIPLGYWEERVEVFGWVTIRQSGEPHVGTSKNLSF